MALCWFNPIGDDAREAAPDNRACTCHPDDAPIPCEHKFAASECWRAAVLAETKREIILIKNRDRSTQEQRILDYLMRVRRALES